MTTYLEWMASLPASTAPPLTLKMCAGCTAQYALEGYGLFGEEQDGSTWLCYRCVAGKANG